MKKYALICIISIFILGTLAYAEKAYNNMPVTMEEYYKLSAENEAVKDESIEMEPQVDDKWEYFPETKYVLRKYNSPPGSQVLNLAFLKLKRQIQSIAVLSGDYNNIAYTSIYYAPSNRYVSSEAFYIPTKSNSHPTGKLKKANLKDRVKIPLAQSGMENNYNFANYTLTILDWSKNSKQLAMTEKISYRDNRPWITNLVVYDFNTQQTKRLWEVREAIEYYWKQKKGITLSDYQWDIKPIGWDELNPDRLIVTAYAYTKKIPKFLGTWSIDYKGDRSQLLSLTETAFEVSINGYALRIKLSEPF